MKKRILNIKSENKVKKIVNGFFAGIIPSFLLYAIIGYIFTDASKTEIPTSFALVFFTLLALFIYWSYHADVIRRIWARMLLSSAIFSFIFPIATFIFGIKQTVNQEDAFAMAGSAIGTGLATIFIGFLMLLVGLAFSLGAYFTYQPLRER